MRSVAIVSALYGDIDAPTELPEQDIHCTALMVTDRPRPTEGWENLVEPRPWLHDRMAAKLPKTLPFDYHTADISIWVDASMQITSPGFARWCVQHLGSADVAAFQHPYHDHIEEEVVLASGLAKYAGQDMEAQAEHYLTRGFPLKWGLWASGLMVFRNNEKVHHFGRRWLAEQARWSVEDQVSLPYALWAEGVTVVNLPWIGWRNELLILRNHTGSE